MKRKKDRNKQIYNKIESLRQTIRQKDRDRKIENLKQMKRKKDRNKQIYNKIESLRQKDR